MSNSGESKVCPNCGYLVTDNYCGHCGQAAHLHKETFWGLIGHFISHYIHYDSKFLTTIRTLWFKPGQLTIAYWKQQRMKFLPPISLYIFVSAVFFLAVAMNPNKFMNGDKGEITFRGQKKPDTAAIKKYAQEQANKPLPWYEYDPHRDTANFMHFIVVKGEVIDAKTSGNLAEYIIDHIYHTIPKVFFFMIPLMAFFLGILFMRRHHFFVNHAVFSLHFHSFVFSILILLYIPFVKNIPYLPALLLLVAFIYLVAAIRNAYEVKLLRAFTYSILLGVGYFLFLVAAVVVDFLAIFYFA